MWGNIQYWYDNLISFFVRLGKQYLIYSDLYDPGRTRIKLYEKHIEQLLQKNAQLEQHKKNLEGLSQEWPDHISMAAHDLRQPLSRSIGLSQILKGTQLSDEQREIVNQLESINRMGLYLVDDVLRSHTIEDEQLQLVEINLSQFITRNIALYFRENALQKNIAIHTAVEDDLKITTDPLSLGRIVDNLVSNALKFSRPSTQIFIKVLSIETTIYISVQDQGPGISSDDQKKLFKKFGRLSAKPTAGESSTGLGLTIVKSLVQKLGGQISVQSTLGKGTEFTIRLSKITLPIDHHESRIIKEG